MRKIVIYSWLCILVCVALGLWTWSNLPVLETYPVHWNAEGKPDRFGSKSEVMFALTLLPCAALFSFLLFVLIPKIEPIQASIKPNTRAFTAVWAILMTLYLVIQLFIARSYAGLDSRQEMPEISIRLLVMAMGLFYIFMGNMMGKLRQNFLFGIRTPWTLSSDMAWEKTHRLTGRLMFAAGVATIFTIILFGGTTALYVLIFLSILISVLSLIYSYMVWQADPEKRT
jgi:uncharacterized membrane protein